MLFVVLLIYFAIAQKRKLSCPTRMTAVSQLILPTIGIAVVSTIGIAVVSLKIYLITAPSS